MPITEQNQPILKTFKSKEWRVWGEGYICDDERFLQVVKVEFPDAPGRNFLEIQMAYPDGEVGFVRFRLALAKHRRQIAEEVRVIREELGIGAKL